MFYEQLQGAIYQMAGNSRGDFGQGLVPWPLSAPQGDELLRGMQGFEMWRAHSA
jgi:hypothetical protein